MTDISDLIERLAGLQDKRFSDEFSGAVWRKEAKRVLAILRAAEQMAEGIRIYDERGADGWWPCMEALDAYEEALK